MKAVTKTLFILMSCVLAVGCNPKVEKEEKKFILKDIGFENDKGTRIISMLSYKSIDNKDSVTIGMKSDIMVKEKIVIGDTVIMSVEMFSINGMNIGKSYIIKKEEE
jgi:hypothetical protein